MTAHPENPIVDATYVEEGGGGDSREWRPVFLLFPLFALCLDSRGTHRRLLLPGRYLKRRSRRYRETVYRRAR